MKTLKKVPVIVEFVDSLPFEVIEDNILYVCKEQMKMRHNCLCGCGTFIDIPLTKIDDNGDILTADSCWWNLTLLNDKVTITPSILNNPCKGHYIITNGVANLV